MCLPFPLSSFCLLQNWSTVHISVHIAHLSYYLCLPSAAPAACAWLFSPASCSAPWFAPSFCNTTIHHKSLSFTKLAIINGWAPATYNVQCKWNLYSVRMGSFLLRSSLSLYQVLTKHSDPSGSLQNPWQELLLL